MLMAATPVRQRRPGHWKDFIAAIRAMNFCETLIWDMPEGDIHTARARRSQMHTQGFKTVANWFDGKYFVVRVK